MANSPRVSLTTSWTCRGSRSSSRARVVGPEPMVRARLCTPRRAASCRLASPRVASCRPASRRLGLARPRKVSPVTFNFRAPFEKPLSPSLSCSLSFSHSLFHDTADGELGRRPSAPECCAVSRAAPIAVSPDRQRAPLAEKKFSLLSMDFREATTGEIEPRLVAKSLVLHLFSLNLFSSGLLKSLKMW